MTAPRVLRAGGRPLALGERIGRGGEGEVYALRDRPELAVKLYTGGKLGERREKIAAMVQAGLAAKSPLVAFPAGAVIEASGRFVGFTMRRIVDCKPLFELYAPGARKLAFPKANYRFLVAAAANIARAVASVHEAGCVIGDINQSGILVSENALAALIDADSFQFIAGSRRFACHVGVPNYTPPELQNRKLDGVVRTVEHDRFGLAVVLFQLLFMGRHPYAGAYRQGEMPIERAIAEHRFAYSLQRAVGLKPPPGVVTLGDVSPAVAAAFEAAFGPAPDAGRPAAKDWTALLSDMEAGLQSCAANALHHHDPVAPECPWCRMEAKQGIALFLPAGAASAGGAARLGMADVAEAWRQIEAAGSPPHDTVRLPPSDPPPPPGARAFAARRMRWLRRGAGVSGLGAAATVAGFGQAGWTIWAAPVVLGIALLARDDAATRAMRAERDDIERRWAAAMNEWHRCCSAEPFRQLRSELERARGDYRLLPQREAERIAEYRRARRGEHLAAHLAGYPIVAQVVPGVDRSLAAMLRAHRIASAADIGSDTFKRVPGLGARAADQLLAWRAMLERGFVYDANPTALDRRRLSEIQAESAQQAAALRKTLLGGGARLREVRREIEYRRAVLEPQLVALRRQRGVVQADLAAVIGAGRRRVTVTWGPPAAARRRSTSP